MVSTKMLNAMFGVSSCQLLKGGWGKTSRSVNDRHGQSKYLIPSRYGNSLFSGTRIAILMASVILCLVSPVSSMNTKDKTKKQGFTNFLWNRLFSLTFVGFIVCIIAIAYTVNSIPVGNGEEGAIFGKIRMMVIAPCILFMVGAFAGLAFQTSQFREFGRSKDHVEFEDWRKDEFRAKGFGHRNVINFAVAAWFLVVLIFLLTTNLGVGQWGNGDMRYFFTIGLPAAAGFGLFSTVLVCLVQHIRHKPKQEIDPASAAFFEELKSSNIYGTLCKRQNPGENCYCLLKPGHKSPCAWDLKLVQKLQAQLKSEKSQGNTERRRLNVVLKRLLEAEERM